MSTTLKELPADELAALADAYTRLSTTLFEFRLAQGLTGKDEHLVRVECEEKLDALAAVLRGKAIALVVTDAQLKAGTLRTALDAAGKTLAKLEKVHDVIALVTNVIALGGAILSGNARAIVQAVKAFRSEEEDEGDEEGEGETSPA